MSRHVVIGTAGHVDHGKTALVRALTGVDTDRWEEEKRRGITIDLGFAPLTLADGVTASIVDVPGHEDFVRNMVAGATGVDVALLVVAADEGVMPQTIEHLAILEFLGVHNGVAAVTKVDLADAEWLDLVRADLEERLAAGGIRWSAVVPVSAVTATGLDELRAALAGAATAARARATNDLFRMPIDRAFSVAGAGTVVTGTAWSGTLAVGDAIRILPGDATGRVRGIEVHGAQRPAAEPGRRTALALAGVDRAAVRRGQCAVEASAPWRATSRVDVRATLLPHARPMGQRARVRVHIGTAEVLARVTPLADALRPGEPGIVRLRLESPVVARWGDRGVLRSYSPVTTVGGFVVLDPLPPPRPRRPVGAAALARPVPAERLAGLVEREAGRGVAVDELPLRLGIRVEEVDGVLAATDAVVDADARLFPAARFREAQRAVRDVLARHHEREPLEPGLPLERLRRVVRPAALAERAQRSLAAQGAIVVDGSTARLAKHQAGLPAGLEGPADTVARALREAGYTGATVAELATRLAGIEMSALSRLLGFFVRQGTARRIGGERYYDAAIAGEMVRQVRVALAEHGEVSPAQLRERIGLTRKYLIPFLEWLDREGYTVRVGDVRRRGPKLDAPDGAP